MTELTETLSYSALFFFPILFFLTGLNWIINHYKKNKHILFTLVKIYKLTCIILVMFSSTGFMISLNKEYSIISLVYIVQSYTFTVYILYIIEEFCLKNIILLSFNILSSIALTIILFYTVSITPDLEVFNNLFYFCVFTYTIYPAVSVSYLLYFYIVNYNRYTTIMSEVEISNMNNEECSICLEQFTTNKVVELRCSHKFHKHCIIKSMETRQDCPLCRQDISV